MKKVDLVNNKGLSTITQGENVVYNYIVNDTIYTYEPSKNPAYSSTTRSDTFEMDTTAHSTYSKIKEEGATYEMCELDNGNVIYKVSGLKVEHDTEKYDLIMEVGADGKLVSYTINYYNSSNVMYLQGVISNYAGTIEQPDWFAGNFGA